MTAQYQASDFVDFGRECRLEGKSSEWKDCSGDSYLGVSGAWFRAVGHPQTPLHSSKGTPKPSYCTTTVLLHYYRTTTVLLLYYCTSRVGPPLNVPPH